MKKMISNIDPRNIEIEWAKGHATDRDVHSGRTTEEHRRQNDRADHAADDGRRQHEEGLQRLCRLYRLNAIGHQDFIMKLRAYTLAVLKMTMNIMKQLSPGAHDDGGDDWRPPRRKTVTFRGLPRQRHGEQEQLHRRDEDYLAHAYIAPTDTDAAILIFLDEI